MNDLLIQAQKEKINSPVADLPLNQAFWALVEKNMTRGEIRELFFKDKDASKRRELAYIPGDPAFMSWQQTILAIDNSKEQKKQVAEQQQAASQQAEMQAEQQAQQQDMENKHAEAKHSREQEKHDMEMAQMHANAAANVAKQSNPLRDSAKEFGASKATNVGGKVLANPINKIDEE